MILRGLSFRDLTQLEEIHKNYYSNEFELDELENANYLARFSVVEDDKLITSGGVRLIPEVVLITDKSIPVKTRREALVKALQASKFIAGRSGHASLHAFIQDEVWLKQLLKHGFRLTKGVSIVTNCEE